MIMKRYLLSAVFCISILSNLNAQVVLGNAYYDAKNSPPMRSAVNRAVIQNNDEILIEVNGLLNVTADTYVAVFNVVQTGETLEDVNRMIDERLALFKKNLKNIGIGEDNIKMDLISFVPRFDIQTESKLFSKSYNEVPAGYEVQKNISVLFTKSSQIDAIMSSALNAEIYDIVKVDYFINNLQVLKDSLRNACVTELKKKITVYEIVGLKLDNTEKNISESFLSINPPSRYLSYQAFTRPSLNAAKKKQSYTEIPKVTSKYYNQQDYSQYDIVINPVVTEPVIQLSYSIIMKCVKEDKEDKDDKTYNIITPSGDIKQLVLK